jgi:hypothetical protein
MQLLIAILFFLFVHGSLGIVQFYICPHEVMPDKDKGGFITLQFIGGFAATFWLFTLLTDLYDLEYRFGDKDWQRILFVICLAFVCFFILGLLIEGFLILTDKGYRKWRFAPEE